MTMRDRLAGALLGLAACACAPGGSSDEGWERITPPLALVFPRDHGAHPRTRTEWWYVTGDLRDDAGNEFGFQWTVFRRGMDPTPPREGESALRARHVLAGHFAIADLASKRLLADDRLRRPGGGLAGFAEDDLRVWIEDLELARAEDGALRLSARRAGPRAALDLRLVPRKPLVLQGDRGLSAKGAEPGNASAYVSWTRLAAEGTLETDGGARAVRGEAWFDHEWGTSQLGPGVVGWDWMGLRLDDGRDLMLYRLRRADGSATPFASGALVDVRGAARTLRPEDFSMEPTGHWTSPRTGARYPVRWRIRVPSAGIDAAVEPRLEDAELDTRATTGVVYWEGPVRVAGSASGRGYAELTGYAASMEGSF